MQLTPSAAIPNVRPPGAEMMAADHGHPDRWSSWDTSKDRPSHAGTRSPTSQRVSSSRTLISRRRNGSTQRRRPPSQISSRIRRSRSGILEVARRDLPSDPAAVVGEFCSRHRAPGKGVAPLADLAGRAGRSWPSPRAVAGRTEYGATDGSPASSRGHAVVACRSARSDAAVPESWRSAV